MPVNDEGGDLQAGNYEVVTRGSEFRSAVYFTSKGYQDLLELLDRYDRALTTVEDYWNESIVLADRDLINELRRQRCRIFRLIVRFECHTPIVDDGQLACPPRCVETRKIEKWVYRRCENEGAGGSF